MFGTPKSASLDIETVRKNAQILVIDDQEWPYQAALASEGYHIERWPDVQSLSRLTDGYYSLILLDIHGVGLKEDPKGQGIGILDYIKRTNPSQRVIVYSAKRQLISSTPILTKADAIFDKGESYVNFRVEIDKFLVSGATPGYFISTINRELGGDAASVPRLIPKALKALRTGNISPLARYLESTLNDEQKVKIIVSIVTAGFKVLSEFAK
ncbi:hypothetical protein EV379_2394 [Microterricola gilva]|uniref:Response regulator receiver domain-containing protein n=1 Tax=Microterricola gilva TaxID=393267 RepID=A0A4Q8AND7_9MICO|nr:hypothetical protein [Microterricola gilva]RZU66048.1 hypothetical protein EV379_2394 [Microterricola gilva]